MKPTHKENSYVQMGMAAMLPGMQYMIERMQAELDEMRAHLARLQSGGSQKARADEADPYLATQAKNAASYWAKMTPKERSAEMKRRIEQRKRKAKREYKTGYWASMTSAERRAEVQRRMKLGKRNSKRKKAAEAALPTAKLAKENRNINGRAVA